MGITILKASCDLGTHVDGASLGPDKLVQYMKLNNTIQEVKQPDITKSHDVNDKHKNETAINQFNTELYQKVSATLAKGNFPITIGGDHSIAIASALASIKKYSNLGIIWFDSHADYNTFETTITGNIHGLPLAAINGLNKELSTFHTGSYYNPHNTVIVGYRALEDNQADELNLVKKMGVTIFTTKDIKEQGIETIVNKALQIAGHNTNGIHISYDLDVIDPLTAPGVSIMEKDGISEQESYKFIDCLITYQKKITSFDLVELNPLNDINNKTLILASNILEHFMKNIS